MAKTLQKLSEVKKAKHKKEPPKQKDKNGDALVGRVKKVIKKSRRKMGDEKFEKQLQRTIAFLEELQHRMSEAGNAKTDKKAKPTPKANKSNHKKTGKKGKAKAKSQKSKVAASSQAESTASK